MKVIWLKITASAAMLIGIIASITGTRVLLGVFNPGYPTFTILIYYNILMGLVSIFAGYLIWVRHTLNIYISGLITAAHISVLVSLFTIFSDFIAIQSVNAMTFRSGVWILIFVSVFLINRIQR